MTASVTGSRSSTGSMVPSSDLAVESTPGLLAPYVPRLLRQWARESPETTFREVEGTIVFVDVSGFTKLSERLARLGKVGAEELVDAIGTCFTRLLAVAYDNDGNLIKFGGDALLLLYTGEDHAIRACRAAVGMRRTLREIGRLDTPGGRVVLRMSVGIHSGVFHFFLVGHSHRELIITGPAATETVRMEGAADAGEILISHATAAAVPRNLLGQPKGPGVLLRREPQGQTDALSIERALDDDSLVPYIPVALRDRFCSGLNEPEHRKSTIGFIKFQGTDELIDRAGPAETAGHLDQLVCAVQQAVDRHGVSFLSTDIDQNGGKFVLTAGVPTSSGNDEERMLLALREIADGKRAVRVRIGVNSGHVFAGDVGPPYRRTYTVMGDAVNLAARLMAKAEPGQIIASPGVLDHSRTTFRAVALEPFTVKGKSRPVHAMAVGAVVGTSERIEGHRLPLIGRDDELSAFERALDAARAGTGQLVEILGDPGLGKTRLVEAFIEAAEDIRRLRVACELYEASTPYFPMRGLLRSALGAPEGAPNDQVAELLCSRLNEELPDLLPWAPLLGILLDVELPATPETKQLDERFRRPRLHDVALQLLRHLLPGPTLLVFEDAQWMDEASADLLRHLATWLSETQWVLCVTRRDGEGGFAGGEEMPNASALHLSPLTLDATTALAMLATDDDPLPQHELAVLVERSGGNPLLLRELVSAVRAAGGVEELPDSVETLVTARIDRLADRDRNVLRHLAVLGQSFARDLAESVVPEDASLDDRWHRLGEFLIRDDSVIRFQNTLIRDAAYGGLPYRLRRELHAKVGGIIESSVKDPDTQAEMLSFHFFHAQHYAEAWRYSLSAAERAQAIYANVEAAEFFHRALDAARRVGDLTPEEVARVHELSGDVWQRVGEFAKAGDCYRQARVLWKSDPVCEARLLLKQAIMQGWLERYSQGLRWISRGLRLLEDEQDTPGRAQRAQLLVSYAQLRQQQGRHRDALRWSRRAIEEAQTANEKAALAQGYKVLDWAFTELGQPELATHSHEALQLYTELGDLSNQAGMLNNLGTWAYWKGNWDEALTFYRQANELDEKVGDVVNAAFGRNNVGEILADQGRLSEAQELFEDAVRVLRAARHRNGIAYVSGNLARVAALSGRFDEALELFSAARDESAEVGAEVHTLDIDARIAECHLLQGNAKDAFGLAEAALGQARKLGGVPAQLPVLHRIRGYAFMQRSDYEAAHDALEESLRAARTRNADYELALTMNALVQLAELEGKEFPTGLATASEEIFKRLGVIRLPEVPLSPRSR